MILYTAATFASCHSTFQVGRLFGRLLCSDFVFVYSMYELVFYIVYLNEMVFNCCKCGYNNLYDVVWILEGGDIHCETVGHYISDRFRLAAASEN